MVERFHAQNRCANRLLVRNRYFYTTVILITTFRLQDKRKPNQRRIPLYSIDLETIMRKTGRLFPSSFFLSFEKNGLVALVHRLKPEPVYLLKQKWDSIVSCMNLESPTNQDIISDLVIRNLFITDLKTDQQMLELIRKQSLEILNRPTILYLMMAQDCNFACKYCPIPDLAIRYGKHLLSFEDAIRGIMLWEKHINEQAQDQDNYFLIFYGGEPLLNREVLEQLLPYIVQEQKKKKLPKNLELMLCTNGSLIDERLSKLLAYYKVTVAIGIDGTKEYNDSTRIIKNSNSSFNKINSAIRLLVNSGVRVVASVIITPANVNYLADYPVFLKKLGIHKFGFNLMKGKALIRDINSSNLENYCQKAAKVVLKGLENISKDGRYFEYQLEKKITSLKNGMPFSVDCTCYGNQLVIQADGQVTNCPFLRFDQGHIQELPKTFRIGQTEIVNAWRYRLPLFNDSIMVDNSNSLLNGGGCAWSSLDVYGDVTIQDSISATFTREIMHELIWTLLPKGQADAIIKGKTSHWSYRRFWTLPFAGTVEFENY